MYKGKNSKLSKGLPMHVRSEYRKPSILGHLLLGVFLLIGISNFYCNSLPLDQAGDTISASKEGLSEVNQLARDNQLAGGIQNVCATCYMNASLQILQAFYG